MKFIQSETTCACFITKLIYTSHNRIRESLFRLIFILIFVLVFVGANIAVSHSWKRPSALKSLHCLPIIVETVLLFKSVIIAQANRRVAFIFSRAVIP